MAEADLTASNVIIYGLIDPRSGKLFYVGRTGERGMSARMCVHRQSAKRNTLTRCARMIRGLLAEGLEPEAFTIEIVPFPQWVEAEQFWIAYLRGIGCDLANHTAGGDGLTGMKRSPETIEKTASAHRGMKRSAETKARVAAGWTPERKVAHIAACRARVYSDEVRQRMSEQRRGRTLTEEHRANVGAAFRGRKLTDEHKAKVAGGVRAAWTPERRANQAESMRVWRRAQEALRRGG